MRPVKWILLMLGFCLAFQSCKKDNDGTGNDLLQHLANCPGKYEGQYMGSFMENGTITHSNVKVTVLSTIGKTDSILLVFEGFGSRDTISASIACDLKSLTTSGGYGSFSEDGNTLTLSFETYWSAEQGTLTKTKSTGFVMLVQDEADIYTNAATEVPVVLRRFGNYTSMVTLSFNDPGSDSVVVFAFSPATGTPDFTSTLTLTVPGNTPNSFHYTSITASDGASSQSKTLSMQIISPECAYILAGDFHVTDYFCFTQMNDTVTVTPLTPTTFQIAGFSVPVQVNCNDNTLTLPRHNLAPDYEVQGEGSMNYGSASQMSFSLDLQWFYQGNLNDECTFMYDKL